MNFEFHQLFIQLTKVFIDFFINFLLNSQKMTFIDINSKMKEMTISKFQNTINILVMFLVIFSLYPVNNISLIFISFPRNCILNNRKVEHILKYGKAKYVCYHQLYKHICAHTQPYINTLSLPFYNQNELQHQKLCIYFSI